MVKLFINGEFYKSYKSERAAKMIIAKMSKNHRFQGYTFEIR